MTVSETVKPHDIEQAQLDDALDDTFPASDPPSQTDPTHGVVAGNASPTEDAVRQRAYEIWQRAGSTHGSHDEHWEQALRELEGETKSTEGRRKARATSIWTARGGSTHQCL
jgi:hypothetical protein